MQSERIDPLTRRMSCLFESWLESSPSHKMWKLGMDATAWIPMPLESDPAEPIETRTDAHSWFSGESPKNLG
jgi:hypothetical protein